MFFFIMTDISHFLFLTVEDSEKYNFTPPVIKEYTVPLPLIDLKQVEIDFELTDPTFSKLVSQINGVFFVKQIAKENNLDLETVKLYLQNLVYHKAVVMIDIFQFSNIYTTTSEIHNFIADFKKQNECIKAIVKDEFVERFDRMELLSFYIGLTNRITMKDFILENCAKVCKINFSKFIHYSLIHKLIRRVNIYPIKKKDAELGFVNKLNYRTFLLKSPPNKEDSPQQIDETIRKSNKEFNSFLDGTHCLDEICCYFEKSRAEIEEKVKNYGICMLEK